MALVLGMREGEEVIINPGDADEIVVRYTESRGGGCIRLGFTARRSVRIVRRKLLQQTVCGDVDMTDPLVRGEADSMNAPKADMPRYLLYYRGIWHLPRTQGFSTLAAALEAKGRLGGWVYEPLGAETAERVAAESIDDDIENAKAFRLLKAIYESDPDKHDDTEASELKW